ncbi:MAG: hypothetical protein SFY68_10985 [Candidatus Sumerlaeia bacterium]|nr:hypothetical protein [Candidatus Sumerlaeia bacterium]
MTPGFFDSDSTPDEDSPKRRQRVVPRIPDSLQAPAEGAAAPPTRYEQQHVPRPHQPQKRLKPEDIVPLQDNPFGPLKLMGLQLIPKTLFPGESTRNILMVYLTGRQRGRVWEDVWGAFPWFLLVIVDLVLYLKFFHSLGEIMSYNFVRTLPLMFGVAVWNILMVSVHVRRVMRTLPLDELLMTRLAYDEIVQGLVLRPMAIQSLMVLLFCMAQLVVPLWLSNQRGDSGMIVQIAMSVLIYLFLSTAVELGSAFGLRAHLCIKSPIIATFKAILDFAFLFGIFLVCIAIAGVITGIFLLIAAVLSIVGIGMILGMMIFFSLVMGAYTFFSSFLKGEASEAMQWCYNHPKEWWIAANDESIDNVERGLFTPWRPLAERYRLRLPGDGFKPQDVPGYREP